MNNKGVVLIISLVVMAMLLVLTGTYLSSLLTEKKALDTEKFVLQSLGLAEAGASQALSELRERIRTDLMNRVTTVALPSVFQSYVTNKDSLGFLRDYAYADGESQFVISGNEARLAITVLNLDTLDTAIQGSYNATVAVTAMPTDKTPCNENPSNKDPTTCGVQTDRYFFYYNYNIESIGNITQTAPSIQKTIKLLQGIFTVIVHRDTFAKFALFTSHHKMPSGTVVWFTANTNFTGPVFTNERFSFANNPSGHFSEEIGQHENKARFYNAGRSVLLDAGTNPLCCERAGCETTPCKDKPTFDKGFTRGQDLINLESSISQADLKREALGGVSEPGYGVYVPNDGTNVLGGIYIKGNQGSHTDDPIVSLNNDGSDNPVYNITRASTTTEITVDYVNNQTKVRTGATTNTYNGIPNGLKNEGIIIYANDDIGSLSGTVARTSKVTVSSERDIVITNHIRYQEYNPNPLSAEGYNNVLGILSWGGNVRIGTTAPNDINIHGVVMAPHGIFTVDNYAWGSPRGIAALLGGVITDFYGPFGTFSGTTQVSGYGRNFVYDARMLQGITPPYFPYMTNFTSSEGDNDNDGVRDLDERLVWQDKSL